MFSCNCAIFGLVLCCFFSLALFYLISYLLYLWRCFVSLALFHVIGVIHVISAI